MSRFSIVVPFTPDANAFDDTLASVLRYRPADAEIIIVHDGTYNDPHGLCGEVELVTATHLTAGGSRLATFLRAAVQHCSHNVTVWIRPGVELDEGWEDSLPRAFADPNVASVTPVIVSSARPSKLLSAGVKVDRFGVRQGVGLGKCVSRRVAHQLQPLGPSIWLAAWRTTMLQAVLPVAQGVNDVYLDAEIALSLRHIGLSTAVADSFVGLVDDPNVMLDDLAAAHGASAQRGFEKFLALPPATSSLVNNVIGDLLRSPVAPRRFKAAFQRLSAIKFRRDDREHLVRLSQLSVEALNPDVTQDQLPKQSKVTARKAA